MAVAYGTWLLGFWQTWGGGGWLPDWLQPWLYCDPAVAAAGPLSE